MAMSAYADSSFLVACYLEEIHSATALAFLKKENPRLPVNWLHRVELAKAIWTRLPNPSFCWQILEEDVDSRRKLYAEKADGEAIALRAGNLLKKYLPRWKKLRSLDVIHVGAAIEGGFAEFLSFDTNSFQRVLAHSEGLSVWPKLMDEEQRRLKL
jgi:predicted nucleic acid-binding protein